jgi:hypothetical protein
LSQEGWEVTGSRYLSFNLTKLLVGWLKLLEDFLDFCLSDTNFLKLRLCHKT